MSLTLNMDFQFTTTIEKLWSALTESDKLAKWIADNDFQPVVGHRFQFRHEPNEYWDGIVDSEVLVVDEPHRLSFTMATGDEKHVVVLTLEDLGNGKVHLHLEQTGFSQTSGLAGAKHGWNNWASRLEEVLVS